jgi:DNA-binding CsgD family transcriptional regulator
MKVYGTQMHWLTLVFIAIETIFFFIQLWDIFKHPQERRQWWYLVLLLLLLCFNLANGLFPDAALPVPVKLQYIVAYGFAYLAGAYFPFYFFKAFELEQLRFHATWGVLLFLIVPYLIFDVLLYLLNDRLVPDREWGVLIPFVYGIVVLTVILRSVLQQYHHTRDKQRLREALGIWMAVLPWQLMSVFAFFTVAQWLRILLANLGWVVITLFKMAKAVKEARAGTREAEEKTIAGVSQEEFLANCLHFGLTRMEILVVQWVYKGKSSKEIADLVMIAEDTVKKHIQNAFRKVGVRNRAALIHKLLNRPN